MSAEESPENVLFDWYHRFIGEPTEKTDVYVGFSLFFAGIAFGTLGIVLFLWSTQLQTGSDLFWSIRRISVVLAALGLPVLMVGIVVLLPVGRRAIAATGIGMAICLIAMAIFASTYPSNWNVVRGADYSAHGVAVYATGLAIVTASTGAALVGHHLERSRPKTVDAVAESGIEPEPEPDETVSDEQIRLDIEESMRDVEYSWGGVRKVRSRSLEVEIDESGMDRSGFDESTAQRTTTKSSDVDDAVAGLKKLRGGNLEQATGEGIDQQASALAELKAKQRAEQQAAGEDGAMGQVINKIGRIVGRE